MPLHPENPGVADALGRLGDAVAGTRRDAQPLADPVDGLVMPVAHRQARRSIQLTKATALDELDHLIHEERVARRTLVQLERIEIGHERTPARDVEQLRATAQVQHDRVVGDAGTNELELAVVGATILAVLVRHGVGVPVQRRVDVATAEHEDAVGAANRLGIGRRLVGHVVQARAGAGIMQRGHGDLNQIAIQPARERRLPRRIQLHDDCDLDVGIGMRRGRHRLVPRQRRHAAFCSLERARAWATTQSNSA